MDLGAYETGSALKSLGLIDGFDMTIEAWCAVSVHDAAPISFIDAL